MRILTIPIPPCAFRFPLEGYQKTAGLCWFYCESFSEKSYRNSLQMSIQRIAVLYDAIEVIVCQKSIVEFLTYARKKI